MISSTGFEVGIIAPNTPDKILEIQTIIALIAISIAISNKDTGFLSQYAAA